MCGLSITGLESRRNKVSCILPEDSPTPAVGDPSCLSKANVLRLNTGSPQLACPAVLATQFETLPHPAPVLATCCLLKLQGLLGNFLVGTEPGKAAMSTAVPNT